MIIMNDENWTNLALEVAPVLYGTLGACVFLLRSLHVHIYQRTFDRRHKPEYINRILLGTVSGGVIGLFYSPDPQTVAAAGVTASLSAAGFLVGYNTDILFSTIERVSNALFPKQQPDPPAAAP